MGKILSILFLNAFIFLTLFSTPTASALCLVTFDGSNEGSGAPEKPKEVSQYNLFLATFHRELRFLLEDNMISATDIAPENLFLGYDEAPIRIFVLITESSGSYVFTENTSVSSIGFRVGTIEKLHPEYRRRVVENLAAAGVPGI